jgi:predicted DNA-binding protein (UPF0251 family)/FtsZ-binding cell division protein ZapB
MTRTYTRRSPEERQLFYDEWMALRSQGIKGKDAAASLGMSLRTLSDWVKHNQVRTTTLPDGIGMQGQRFSPAERQSIYDEVLRLRDAGVRYRAACVKAGISHTTLQEWVRLGRVHPRRRVSVVTPATTPVASAPVVPIEAPTAFTPLDFVMAFEARAQWYTDQLAALETTITDLNRQNDGLTKEVTQLRTEINEMKFKAKNWMEQLRIMQPLSNPQ